MESEYAVVLTTAGSEEEAGALARSILESKLAACVQVQPITSYYVWKGENRDEPEYLLLIKTRHDAYERLEAHIKSRHSYETPEIVEIPILSGSPEYLAWIHDIVVG